MEGAAQGWLGLARMSWEAAAACADTEQVPKDSECFRLAALCCKHGGFMVMETPLRLAEIYWRRGDLLSLVRIGEPEPLS